MKDPKNKNAILLSFYFFSLIWIALKLLVSDNIFFWDTIQLGSLHAHWFYENNFNAFFLPDKWNSGHFPAFGMYLALCWKLFGKTLLVSHLSMVPFILGILWQLHLLFWKKVEVKRIPFAVLAVLAIPHLASQLLLISPDVCLVFFYLLALNSIRKNKIIPLGIAVLGLVITSQRGMIAAFSLFIGELVYTYSVQPMFSVKLVLNKTKPYTIGFLTGIGFFIAHYFQKQWIVYHPDSPWYGSFELASFKKMLVNIGIAGWRMLDFGLVVAWILFFIHFQIFKKKLKQKSDPEWFLFVFFVFFLLFMVPLLIVHQHLVAHRYLLPGILLFVILTVFLILKQHNTARKNLFLFVLIVGLGTGNLWVYPDRISMGWDSTLAHHPYYDLREKMIDYMGNNNIPVNETGSVFPNRTEFKYVNLNSHDNRQFAKFDLADNKYVFQSNVFNEIKDDALKKLEDNWILLKEFEKMNVYIRLYKNPK